jgi:hypothetical protein
VLERVTKGTSTARAGSLRGRLENVSAEIDRLVTAVARGEDIEPLVSALQQRQRERDELTRELEKLSATVKLPPLDQLRACLTGRLRDFRRLMAAARRGRAKGAVSGHRGPSGSCSAGWLEWMEGSRDDHIGCNRCRASTNLGVPNGIRTAMLRSFVGSSRPGEPLTHSAPF